MLDPAGWTEELLRELADADVAVAAAASRLRVRVRVLYGTATRQGGLLRNTVVLRAADGGRTDYAKVHVPGPEGAVFTAGDDLVLSADDHLALACCYDLAFPAFCADLADTGARALMFPMAWEVQRAFVFEAVATARAVENLAYVVCVNQTGSTPTARFHGGSRIVDPLGVTVLEMGGTVGMASAELDLGWVDRLRSSADSRSYPLLADRRPRLPVRAAT